MRDESWSVLMCRRFAGALQRVCGGQSPVHYTILDELRLETHPYLHTHPVITQDHRGTSGKLWVLCVCARARVCVRVCVCVETRPCCPAFPRRYLMMVLCAHPYYFSSKSSAHSGLSRDWRRVRHARTKRRDDELELCHTIHHHKHYRLIS